MEYLDVAVHGSRRIRVHRDERRLDTSEDVLEPALRRVRTGPRHRAGAASSASGRQRSGRTPRTSSFSSSRIVPSVHRRARDAPRAHRTRIDVALARDTECRTGWMDRRLRSRAMTGEHTRPSRAGGRRSRSDRPGAAALAACYVGSTPTLRHRARRGWRPHRWAPSCRRSTRAAVADAAVAVRMPSRRRSRPSSASRSAHSSSVATGNIDAAAVAPAAARCSPIFVGRISIVIVALSARRAGRGLGAACQPVRPLWHGEVRPSHAFQPARSRSTYAGAVVSEKRYPATCQRLAVAHVVRRHADVSPAPGAVTRSSKLPCGRR